MLPGYPTPKAPWHNGSGLAPQAAYGSSRVNNHTQPETAIRWPVAAPNSVEAHTRGAHRSRPHLWMPMEFKRRHQEGPHGCGE